MLTRRSNCANYRLFCDGDGDGDGDGDDDDDDDDDEPNACPNCKSAYTPIPIHANMPAASIPPRCDLLRPCCLLFVLFFICRANRCSVPMAGT